MAKLHLIIVMPTDKVYEGDVERVLVRTTEGEVAILPRHIDYAAALGDGEARIVADGSTRRAHISGGMIHVTGDCVRVLTSNFAWKD